MDVKKLTSVDFDKMIVLGIEEVWGFDRNSKEVVFAFDQIKSGELGGSNDTTYAEGKRGVRLATLKSNKTSNFSCENGYVIFSGLARQLGGEVEIGSEDHKISVTRAENVALTKVRVSGEDTPDDEKDDTFEYRLQLSGIPKAGSMKLYSCNQDKTKKERLLEVSSWTEKNEGGTEEVKTQTNFVLGKNADYIVIEYVGQGVGVSDDDLNDIYLVTYEEEVAVAKRIVNDGESFSADVRLVINMQAQDLCSDLQYLVQCIMPKASVSGEWSLSLGNDPAVHNFSAEASLDVCSIDTELCEFIVC